jgi:DNA (cytosine-5)-methyltransferase 1
MSKKTFGSLFAGVGGFDLGMEQAGWNCQWQVEWDKHCHNVLAKHWPDVPKYWDVRDVDGAKLTPVDCIVFGSPCQDLSVAGKGGGLEGSRSGLFHEAIRIIKEMRNATSNEFPKWSIWENVPGALSSNKGDDFARVIDQMADIGALAIEWHILDAQWFGVAQRRRRVFVLACYDSGTASRCPEKILSVPEDSKRNIKQSRKERKQVAKQTEAVSGEFSVKDGQVADKGNVTVFLPGTMVRQGSGVSENLVPTLRAEHHNGDNFPHIAYQEQTPISFHAKQVPISSDNLSQTLYGQNGVAVAVPRLEDVSPVIIIDGTRVDDVRVYDQGIVPTLKHRMGTGGGQVPLVGIEEPVLAYDGYNNAVSENIYRTLRIGIDSADHIAIPIQGTIIGRSDTAGPQGKGYGEENDPSYTLDTVSQHGVMTPELILRKLTPLECERLMGFPDEHTKYYANGKVVADTNRYKMCGNAVASPVAKWIGEKIYAI